MNRPIKTLADVRAGDEVLIRRTSGATQRATVLNIESPKALPYRAPELCVFEVEFLVDDKRATRGCRASDFISALS